MIDEKMKAMNDYFEDRIVLCGRRGQELAAEDRADEAVFEKVKANIYDVFRTVLSVAEKTGKGDPEAVRSFFAQRAEQIPAGWAAACEKAREHDDVIRMRTEQVKLDAVREIRENFARIWEGEE